MMVPADAAVMTNGRPYVGLVAATAVALRVAKLSPSILTTRDGVSRRSRHELVACLAVTSHRTQSETGDSALVYVFPSASSIRVSACRRTSAGGSRPSFSGEQTGVFFARSRWDRAGPPSRGRSLRRPRRRSTPHPFHPQGRRRLVYRPPYQIPM